MRLDFGESLPLFALVIEHPILEIHIVSINVAVEMMKGFLGLVRVVPVQIKP